MQYTIGVDIGTSGAKAIALSITGEQLFITTCSYSPVRTEHNDWHELDPSVLLNAFIELTASVVSKLKHHQLSGICFSTAMHGLLCVDENGKLLSNLITWADQRSIPQSSALIESGIATEIHMFGGAPVHPMLPLCKINWIKENDPPLFKATYKFIGFKEYLFHELFGVYVLDHSLASATGLFNIHQLTWNDTSLKTAGINEEQLPGTCSPLTIFKGIPEQYASKLGIDPATPFIIGSSDGCLANIGSRCFDDQTICVTIGTSGAARTIISKSSYNFEPGSFAYNLLDGQLLVGGPINNGGILLKWYAEKFVGRPLANENDFNWFLDEAMKAGAGSQGLIFLPYIYGERAPVWDPMAKGAFIGIHNGHTQTHFMRSIIEGICFSLKQVISGITRADQDIHYIVATGGFTRSSSWLQLFADVVNIPVVVREAGDASAIGAAMLAFQSLGLISELKDFPGVDKDEKIYDPQPVNAALYNKLYGLYEKQYDSLRSTFHELHAIQQAIS